ncbi:MAG: type I glutamate--ammonia ligase [Cyanobium sp. CZS 25K]|nr:type I glutamate--ammonia ligase [Cyanobium sp. CZS25K]
MATSAQDVLRRLADDGIERIDLKVADLEGRWHSFGLEAHRFGAEAFEQGLACDSLPVEPGRMASPSSGLVLLPDPGTAWIDPFLSPRSLSLIAAFEAPQEAGASFRHCPRSLTVRALAQLGNSGLADAARFGAEPGFFLFEDLTSHTDALGCGCRVTVGSASPEVVQGELLLTLAALGIQARPTGEASSAPLQSLTLASNDPLRIADALMVSRYVVRKVARRHGWSATFLPRPTLDRACAGMAVHQSLWKAGHPLFCGEGTYAELSQTARWYMGGLLRHGPSLAAFTNPGSNSYRRLRCGPEAPTRMTYARNDPSTVIGVPSTGSDPGKRRVVLRQPDGLANPYLAFSAMLMAGLDGLRRQIDPGPPSDREPAGAAAPDPADGRTLPADLGGALDALAEDRDYLLSGDVFSRELLDDWIALKRQEVEALEHRPHPHEFCGEPFA